MKKKVLILAGIYWNDTWQRHQQFAMYLAKTGYEVYFIEHIISSKITLEKVVDLLKRPSNNNVISKNECHKNIHILNCRYLNPQEGVFYLWNKKQNKKLLTVIGNKFDIVINYLPINTTRDLLDKIEYDELIYDCVRNFTGWTAGKYPSNIEKEEQVLCNRATKIFTDSYFLTNKMKPFTINKDVVQFLPVLNTSWINGIIEKKIDKILDVCYFGNFSELQNNVDVYRELAKKGINIHFWGKMPKSLDFAYVYHGYQNNLTMLCREIIETTDAIVIAYKGNMDGVIPAKIMQALGTGLPVFVNKFYDTKIMEEYLYLFETKEELLVLINNFNFAQFVERKKNILDYINDKDEEHQYEKFVSAL